MSIRQELIDEIVDHINGGTIKKEGYRQLYRNYILCSKDAGWDVNQAVDFFTDCWMRNCLFKTSYTDGKSSDYDEAVAYIRNNYDK